MTVVNFKLQPGKSWSKDLKYKIPKISNKTEKGKWLNGFVQKFFVAGNHNYRFTTAKVFIQLQAAHLSVQNNKKALVDFFKNLKKLKQHHFENQVFSSSLVYQPTKEAA